VVTVRNLAVVGVAALALAACTPSSAPTIHHSSAGLIAWISTPAPRTTSTTRVPLAPAPYCTRANLKLSKGPWFWSYAKGMDLFTVRLTNAGRTICRLSGYPTLAAFDPPEKRLALDISHSDEVVPANLEPGATGEFAVWGGTCIGGTTTPFAPAKELVIELPHEGGVVDTSDPPTCLAGTALEVTQLGELARTATEPLPRNLSSTFPDIFVSPSVTGGRVLHYTLSIQDWSSRPVSLLPCPGYVEILTVGQAAHRYSYKLNCQSVSQLVPGRTVRLAMEVPVPHVATAEQATLTWEWVLTGSSPSVTDTLTVQP
jgi:hypothetical protein